MFLLLLPCALSSPCPPPGGPPAGVSADGAAHVLVADPAVACWWIVDDAGDARLGGRWDRARRDPVRIVALADGRAVVVLREEREEGPRWRLGVRAEGEGERRLPLDLPGAPAWMEAHPSRPLVALAWPERGGLAVWLVDVDTGARTTASVPGDAGGLRFAAEAPALLWGDALALSAWTSDAPR